jgi:hypothetical protein
MTSPPSASDSGVNVVPDDTTFVRGGAGLYSVTAAYRF